MGATQSTEKPHAEKEINAAGCFFSNGTHVLGGLQSKKKQWIVSGFGGGREGSEILPLTAFREVLEELLGLFDVNVGLLHDLYQKHLPKRALFSEGYINYVYTFAQLESILQMIYDSGITSCPFYEKFPLTVQDLLFKRLPQSTFTLENQSTEPGSPVGTSGKRFIRPMEVSVLLLLPAQPFIIVDEFKKDIDQAFQLSYTKTA